MPTYEIYSAGYDVTDKVISDFANEALKMKGIKLAKQTPNKVTDYIGIYFDNIIILEKDFEINKTELKSNNINYNLIEDPYEEDLSIYKKTLLKINKEIRKYYIS
jgi:protein-tyrosine-phosphatase